MATRQPSDYTNPPSDRGDTSDKPGSGAGTSPGADPSRQGEFSEYAPPDEGHGLALDASDAEIEAFMSSVDGELLSAKAELEKLLDSVASRGFSAQAEEALGSNLVGVGIGLGNGTSSHSSGAPGDPVLEVYVIEPAALAETRARLASAAGVSSLSSSDFPMRVVRTGIIDAQPHRFRERPAPCGISVGHRAITAGTLGALSTGNTAPRNGRLLVLSNNHVLANVNAGAIGDAILQPGPFDGGVFPADQIAVLERFVPINFAAGASNVVDCATAWAWPERVRKEFIYLSGGVKNYFRVGAVPVTATPGMQVGKSGRTTQLTRGSITAVGVTINVNYGAGRVGRFVDQISVRAPTGDFSQGGDSGSLIWTWDARRAPVGLLFAGGGGTTFGNRIQRVLAALDVRLVV